MLTELSADHASLKPRGKAVKVPLAEVLDLRTLSGQAGRGGGRSASARADTDRRLAPVRIAASRVSDSGAQVETANSANSLSP